MRVVFFDEPVDQQPYDEAVRALASVFDDDALCKHRKPPGCCTACAEALKQLEVESDRQVERWREAAWPGAQKW